MQISTTNYKIFAAYQEVLSELRNLYIEKPDLNAIIQRAIDLIVKKFDFYMVWYAELDSDENMIVPTLWAGKYEKYLDGLKLEYEKDPKDAKCAMSISILTKQPFGYGDLETDKEFSKWHSFAMEYGYRSNHAFPLIIDGECRSAILIYSTRKHTFTREIVEYLKAGIEEIVTIEKNIRFKQETEEKLSIAKKIAEESDHLKSTFLANISHEIRTPMNHILGFTEILEDTPLDDEQRDMLETIRSSGNNLISIITDIIDLSKICTEQIEIINSHCSIDVIIIELYKTNKELLTKKNSSIDIIIEKPDDGINPIVMTDSCRLKQILSNLINNAIKFTDKGIIKIGYKQKKSFIEFYVEDTGIGISPDIQDIIFDSFRQNDSSYTRIYEGNGLGLAISKGLVTILGGEIGVKSVSGEGSLFYFTIPYHPVVEKKQKPKITTSVKFDGKNRLILIVEDDLFSKTIMECNLKKFNCRVLHASNGKEAVDLCKIRNDISLVLMDLEMPVMNGIDATVEIKKITKNIPIIAVTAYVLKRDKDNCFKAGFDDYVSKPVMINDLIKIFSKHLANAI